MQRRSVLCPLCNEGDCALRLCRRQMPSMFRTVALPALALVVLLSVAHAHDDKPCDKGFVHQGDVTGAEAKLAGLNTYVAYPSRTYRRNGRYPAVLLFTDIYGYKVNNTRLWADNLARQGFLVVVPDFFKGDPWTEQRAFSAFPAWVAQFPNSQVLSEANAVIQEVQKKGLNGYRAGAFGAEGFCWGGKYSDLLATGKKPAVAASVVYHGSRIEPADIDAINAPIYFLQSDPDIDNNFNCTLYQYAVTALDTKRDYKLDTRLRSYEGMAHGYTIRGDPKNATIQAAAKDAFARGAKFLHAHVKWHPHDSPRTTVPAALLAYSHILQQLCSDLSAHNPDLMQAGLLKGCLPNSESVLVAVTCVGLRSCKPRSFPPSPHCIFSAKCGVTCAHSKNMQTGACENSHNMYETSTLTESHCLA